MCAEGRFVLSIGTCQSSSANDEMVRAMVYEGVSSGVSDKRDGDQCGDSGVSVR